MDDFVWRTSISSIARYVPSDSEEITVNTFAALSSDEVCGYQVAGVYIQNYPGSSPNLKPKPHILRRIFGVKPPKRDHLFVSKGPHKLLMPFNSNWEDMENRPLLALITVNIAPPDISKLFSLARDADDHMVTPPVLVSAVHSEISIKFNEYVGKLNRPDSWKTADDIKRIENEFKMIADSVLSHLGVNVERVALNLGTTETQNLLLLEKEMGHIRKRGVIEATAGFDEAYIEMDESQKRLLSSLSGRSEMAAATSQGAEEVIEFVEGARLESLERILLAQIEESEQQSVHARKLREIEQKRIEQAAEIDRVKEIQKIIEKPIIDDDNDQGE